MLTPSGFLTLDSMNYLALASNLGRGLGFQIAKDGYAPAMLGYFAEWPVGYPLVIHLVAGAVGTTPFMASKLLAMVLATATAALIAAVSGRHGGVCALPLSFASYLDIFSRTWSEGQFIFLLVAAAVLLAGLIDGRKRPGIVRSLALAACCLALFLTRYVGAFSLSLLALAMASSLARREVRLAAWQGLLLLGVAGLIILYLHHNTVLTGYATGMPRLPPGDSVAERLAMLLGAIWSELILPLATFAPQSRAAWLVAGGEALGLAWVVRAIVRSHPRPFVHLRGDAQALAFAAVGALYLAAIILLRWRNQFDPYNYRLLGPGTLLLMLAGLRVALMNWPGAARAMTLFIAAMAATSVALAVFALPRPGAAGYLATVGSIERRYASIPSGAIVVFGDDQLRYLRPDLFVAVPLCRPWFNLDESWPDFLDEVDWSHPIYIDMSGNALDSAGCQKSVRAFLAGHHRGELFRLYR
ncbi:MAG: hypothetical protein KGL44_13545 [Sphingomonadales bacterium]|nr:hypothetical protein [Sphingomonadales bacterium]